MGKQVQINLTPSAAADESTIRKIAATLAGIDLAAVSSLRVLNGQLMQERKISVLI